MALGNSAKRWASDSGVSPSSWYASSIAVGSPRRKMRRIEASLMRLPVGLLGVQRKMTLVRSVTADDDPGDVELVLFGHRHEDRECRRRRARAPRTSRRSAR